MLFRNAQTFFDYALLAEDGEIGSVADFLFDDTTWTIRYLVVKTGNWLTGRKVLIGTEAVTRAHGETQQFEVRLTREQVKDSPDIYADQPVSLQHQIELNTYYGWPLYWTAQTYAPIYPALISDPAPLVEELPEAEESRDPHLRSVREVMGYHIQATDDDIGHVDDFLIASESWAIHYLVVDTRNWLPGKQVLMSPRWIQRIDWGDRRVVVHVTQDAVRNSPEYLPNEALSREYEERLHEHYRFPKYWEIAMHAGRSGSRYPL